MWRPRHAWLCSRGEVPQRDGHVLVWTLQAIADTGMLAAGEKPDARTFGPFTPFRERWVGRVAQLGFAGLLLVELLKGNNPVF